MTTLFMPNNGTSETLMTLNDQVYRVIDMGDVHFEKGHTVFTSIKVELVDG